MQKINIAIIGATGYTGSELVRLLGNHPNANIKCITSESKAGQPFHHVHPQYKGICEQVLIPLAELPSEEIDVAFLALPHGVSMEFVKKYANAKFKIIDLSGDFRLSTQMVYEKWYQKPHIFPQGFENAVYGLPEINTPSIQKAKLVANPGCYPTASILAIAPLVANKLVDAANILVDAKSGATGAGVKASEGTHFSNVNDNFKAYGVAGHRHTIEIEESLSGAGSGICTVQFTPHLLPIDRGILATTYTTPTKKVSQEILEQKYREYYKNAPFVRLVDRLPGVKDVRGSNYCDIYVKYDKRTNKIIVISVIDNLVKGAAGQAIHNMNLMFGLEETTGITQAPIYP